MQGKGVSEGKLRKCFLVSAFLLPLPLAGCQMDRLNEPVIETESMTENTRETAPPRYHSDITSEDCFLCEEGKEMPLSMYRGQKNLGIIDMNTMDLSPILINHYSDSGELVEELVSGSTTHITNTGKDGFVFSVTPNVNQGYANGHLSFKNNKKFDMELASGYLCSDCLSSIMKNCWEDNPSGIGVINFSTGEVRLFEEKITAFTFGDYYITCDGRNRDGSEWREIDLLVFYCPERY
jgi:hypothetical protein